MRSPGISDPIDRVPESCWAQAGDVPFYSCGIQGVSSEGAKSSILINGIKDHYLDKRVRNLTKFLSRMSWGGRSGHTSKNVDVCFYV